MNRSLSGQRILVVEDEAIVAWALEDMLAGMGCSIVGPAARVGQALAMIETADIDAAVIDVNLNGQKCYPVADALAARGVPFIFSTAYNRTSLQGQYPDRRLLQKPFGRAMLRGALADLLNPDAPQPSAHDANPAVWDANRLRIATDAAGVGLWSWNVDTGDIAMDDRSHQLWGVPSGPVTFEDLSARIHPEDLDRVRSAFDATRDIRGAYEVDFRILHGADVRWVSARGQGDNRGIVGRLMFGVFLDATGRKAAEDAREMIAGEMGHRVKNLLAMASALAGMAARSTTTSQEMFKDFTQRLSALGRAHDLIRPVPGEPKRGAHLRELVDVLLAPYGEEEGAGTRIVVSMPEMTIGEASATAISLIIHELATNSIKYGALSLPTGHLDVSGSHEGDHVALVWTEWGVASAPAPGKEAGFGTKLVSKTISAQLGGTIDYDWVPSGLVVTLRLERARLAN